MMTHRKGLERIPEMSSLPPADRPERVRALANDIYVVDTAAGAVLVNCPPETLKYLLASQITPPTIVLLPPDVPAGRELGSSGFVRRGINYASVEFLIYSSYFIHGRKATLITVTRAQAERLRRILQETINGPDSARYGPDAWLHRECAAVGFYPPLGRAPKVDDMVMITALEAGGGDLGAATITLEGETFVFSENGAPSAYVPTTISKIALPLTLAPPQPLHRQELTLQFIGGSDGFDPTGITTCFLAYLGTTVDTQATLFDTAAYMLVRLGNLGISPRQISAVVLSHLHEDHLAGLPELILMGGHRVRLITSDMVYQSLLCVLSAMLDLPEYDVRALFDHYPLNPGTPLELDGRRFETIYAIHSIPTMAVRVAGVCYSGDMRYDEDWFSELELRGVLTNERRAELLQFADGASVLVQDVGGGTIHSTITPRLLQALTAKSQRLVLAHTSKHLLPGDSAELAGRVEFAGSGKIVAMGAEIPDDAAVEVRATIAACPLFARLSVTERLALAGTADVVDYAAGAIITREGDQSDGCAYIVHSGLVEIRISGAQVRVLARGSSIGERGAILGDVRTSTMVARGPVQLLRFGQAVFRPVAEQLGLAQSFARAEWLAQVPVLRELPWASLLDLALDLEPHTLQPDEQLFAHGEPGFEGFLLVSGAMRFTNETGALIEQIDRPGEFFGGRAALYGTPRSASAYAAAPSEVWALPATTLERLNMLYPNILLHLRAVEAGHQQRSRAQPDRLATQPL
jgi:CRP-like cAMP-binding protein/ribonuclease BN (tRNA processing enzyme)